MKNLFLICLLISSNFIYGQKLTVTSDGLRDLNDTSKTYIVIISDGKTSKTLFDNSLKYINKKYKSPEDVIKGKIEGECLKSNTHVENFLIVNNSGAKIPVNADYTIELNFKDGKVRFEVTSIDMYAKNGGYKVLFNGGAFDGYPIFNKKGELKRPDTKNDIETYFNEQINSISEFLLEKNNTDNW